LEGRPVDSDGADLNQRSAATATVFAALYTELSPSVLGYLTVRGVDDPESVTHDVFLAALPLITEEHSDPTAAKPLIFTIAHARVVDHYRKRARTPVSVSYVAEADERTTASAEQRVVDDARHSEVVHMLNALSDDQREVMLLRVVADLPIEQVATIMGRSPGSVKQLQRRALGALRDQVATRGGAS
jgi:RNA polymerase sigma-70 factor, ECF subfamily